ncbi:MAG: aminotransferase class III-fold pyridoxal phosphate-dependent enzyme, partial [Pseudomonadota bacterium]
MSGPKDQALRQRAKAVIPNGMYGHQSVANLPDSAPQFFSHAKGAYLWDADGKRYIDYMCGYGPNLLGYGHDEIDAAYTDQLAMMDVATGPGEVMVDLAEA